MWFLKLVFCTGHHRIKYVSPDIPLVFQLDGAAGGESEAGDLERLEKDSLMSGMSSVLPPGGMTEEQAVQVYNNYNFSHKYDPNLSITQYHDEVRDRGCTA